MRPAIVLALLLFGCSSAASPDAGPRLCGMLCPPESSGGGRLPDGGRFCGNGDGGALSAVDHGPCPPDLVCGVPGEIGGECLRPCGMGMPCPVGMVCATITVSPEFRACQ